MTPDQHLIEHMMNPKNYGKMEKSDAIGIRPPIAVVIGLSDRAKIVLKRVYDYIESIGPEIVVLIDGGFVYPLLRFELPTRLNVKPRFRVMHIVELLVESIEKGRLKLKYVEDKVTWHPPCQMTRRGGLTIEHLAYPLCTIVH
ncbi:MAG TPA: (Fe-S)-binding protein [Pyrodictiaceae archaeon]|nr:(Fe-S)-binding protein [Pyrodictiaceae archaeon]